MKKEIKYGVFVISLIIFAAASFKAQENNNPLPTLSDDEAIEKLKQNGQYDGLMEAVKTTTENPTTADAFVQSAKLFAADGAAFYDFGLSVSISGDTAIIGSYQAAVGGNGVQGTAYVFVNNGGTWTLQQKLTASDGAVSDQFGFSVSIDGDTAIVGAWQDNIGLNNEQGSAYVFVRSGTVWTEQQKLTASDGDANDFFGDSVSIDGDTVVVGAYGGIAVADLHPGSAYVFVRNGTTWIQQQKLTASDGEIGDGFGFSVSISGETAIVGSWQDNVGANNQQGSAYVFVRSGTTWTQQAYLIASDGTSADTFGISVAIEGPTAIVGADSGTVGGNPFQGSAYVFVRSGTVWTEQQKLIASDGANGDQFGRSVAISGDTAIVGAGDDNGGSNFGQGSAYVFSRNGTTWTQQQNLTASDTTAGAHLGVSVAISGHKILVGAPRADVSVSNLIVPQVADQGAVYVFVDKVFVGGRILTAGGVSGVPKVIVQLTKPNGEVIHVLSTSFGYYRFDDLDAGETYTISVGSKRFTFTPQIVQPNDNLTDVDFIALP